MNKYGIVTMFIILGIAYFIIMFVGHLLLKKPDGWFEPQTTEKTNILKEMIKHKEFIGIWIMFYLNIHCGLMIISYEKQLLNIAFATSLSPSILGSVLFPVLSPFIQAVNVLSETLGHKSAKSFWDIWR